MMNSIIRGASKIVKKNYKVKKETTKKTKHYQDVSI